MMSVLDAHPGRHHASVLQAGRSDLLAQGLDKIDVPLGQYGLDLLHHDLVGHDMPDVIVVGTFAFMYGESMFTMMRCGLTFSVA